MTCPLTKQYVCMAGGTPLPDVGHGQDKEGESSVEKYLVPPVGKLHVNFVFCQISHHKAWSAILQSKGLHNTNKHQEYFQQINGNVTNISHRAFVLPFTMYMYVVCIYHHFKAQEFMFSKKKGRHQTIDIDRHNFTLVLCLSGFHLKE